MTAPVELIVRLRAMAGWRPGRIGRRYTALASLLVVLTMAGTGVEFTPYPDAARDGASVTTGIAGPGDDRARGLRALQRLAPRGRYIVVDQTNNRLYLRRGDAVLLEAICSAGSGLVLSEGQGGRQWTFDTPRGRFEVLGRVKSPIWRKPDWAFVEAGEPIPDSVSARLEPGTLGEYALDFGNGFMIHGTLYERLLGRSVTHGCIRLGRDDLRRLWAQAPLGTPIYIY